MTNTPMLTEEEAEAWTAAYDRRGDTMYVNLKPNRAAFRAIEGPATIVRRYSEDGKLIGLTLLDAASPAPLAPLPNPLVLDSVGGRSYSASSTAGDAAPRAAPQEGWVLVPREPSTAMCAKGALMLDKDDNEAGEGPGYARGVWWAMIDALEDAGNTVKSESVVMVARSDALGSSETSALPPNPPASDALLESDGVPTVEHPSSVSRTDPEQVRALAGDWHRRAQSLFRHNGMGGGEAAWMDEQRAQLLTDCAEQLEKIVGPADPF